MESYTALIDQDCTSDDDLMTHLGGERASDALGVLQSRYGRRIQHFVHGLVKDSHLAGDVTQEVFEKAYLKRDLYRQGTSFRAWLFEVARNQALSALRKQKRCPRPISGLTLPPFDDRGSDWLDQLPQPEEDHRLEEDELMAAFETALHELPERYRAVFDLCVREGETYEHAARVLSIPTGTVAIQIMRARQRLFRALARHLGRLRRPPACLQ